MNFPVTGIAICINEVLRFLYLSIFLLSIKSGFKSNPTTILSLDNIFKSVRYSKNMAFVVTGVYHASSEESLPINQMIIEYIK